MMKSTTQTTHFALRHLLSALLLSCLTLPGTLVAQQGSASRPAAETRPRLSAEVRRYVTVDTAVVALVNARVVDGTGAAPRDGQTIIVADGRIREVGPSARVRVPRGVRTIDLAGHTVIPGIVGLHNHTWYTTSGRAAQLPYSAPRLYLGSGVTTIRTTGSLSPYEELNMKVWIDRGSTPGPRMHVTGPYITGANTSQRMYNVTGPADARRVVAYWAEEGASWFKVYTRISRAELAAVIEEAHSRGLKVTGHLCSVSFQEAVELKIDNLEHGLFVNTDWDPEKTPDNCPAGAAGRLRDVDLNSPGVRQTIRAMVDNGVPMTSTLAVYEISVPNRPPLEQRVLDAMSPEVREEYLATRTRIAEGDGFGVPLETFTKAQQFELMFVRAGGLLASGVDPTGIGGALPGFGDQRNFELLVEAGFTPLEVVTIMTANGARILGEYDQYGSIEAGKRADLVIIRGDPIARPAEIRNVVTVFRDGVGYDSARLIESVKGQVGVR